MLVVLLAGCQVEEAGSGNIPGTEGDARRQCEADGGQYGPGGFGGPTCVRNTPDAGKACSQASDCTGFCLAESRTCSPKTPFFGCHTLLVENGQEVEICID